MNKYLMLLIFAVTFTSREIIAQVQPALNLNQIQSHDFGIFLENKSLLDKIVVELERSKLEYRILENGKIEHLLKDKFKIMRLIFYVKECHTYVSYENGYTMPIPCHFRTTSSKSIIQSKYNSSVWFDDKIAMNDLKMRLDKVGIKYRYTNIGDIEYHNEDRREVNVIINSMIKCQYGKNNSNC